MEKNNPFETINYIPVENKLEVAQKIRDWVQVHMTPHLKMSEHSFVRLNKFDASSMYLELGGYQPDPTRPGKEIPVECTFNIDSNIEDHLDPVADPEGTYWHRRTLHAQPNWPSYGSMHSAVARLRLNLIEISVTLAEQFNAEFGNTLIWHKGATIADRKATALRYKREATVRKAFAHIKQAIHTTCKRMRVGDERFIAAPADCVLGDYEIEVENKTYKVCIRLHGFDWKGSEFHFKRVK